jgi:hypothetical protein
VGASFFSAEFDINSPVTLREILTKMEWVNPHAWLHIDVKDEDGKTVAWMIETAAPNALFRRGLYEEFTANRRRDPRRRFPSQRRE